MDGSRVALALQVSTLLLVLIESSGGVVTRAELQTHLWPDTHTDRERGLNNAINRLREALGDSAVEPRFIETVPKRGYRFLARVELVNRRPLRLNLALAALVAACLAGVLFWIRRPAPTEPPAPTEYWAALRRLKLGGVRDLAEARALLETTTTTSPSFAPGHAALASVLLDLVDAGRADPVIARGQASNAAQTAVRLRNESSDAHLAMGIVRLRGEWKFRLAGEEIDRALRLNPKSAEAWRARATLLLARGDAAHAVEASEHAVALDPLSPWTQTAIGRAIYYQGDTRRSAERLKQTLRIAPDFSPAHRYLSEVYWQIGRKEDARTEFMAAMRLAGTADEELRRFDVATAQDGLPGYWRSELADLHARESSHGVPFKLAAIYAALDQPDRAVEALEMSIGQKDAQLLFLRVNPRFDKLRSDPRFDAILQRIAPQSSDLKSTGAPNK